MSSDIVQCNTVFTGYIPPQCSSGLDVLAALPECLLLVSQHNSTACSCTHSLGYIDALRPKLIELIIQLEMAICKVPWWHIQGLSVSLPRCRTSLFSAVVAFVYFW